MNLQMLGRKATVLAERSPLLFAITAIAVLECATLLLLRSCYETNDDVFITMIASGTGICTAPDPHLVFTNIVIGHALNWLYIAVPNFPWYGAYLFVTHFAAQVAILYCALTIGRQCTVAVSELSAKDDVVKRCGLYALYYVLVEVPLLCGLQFTTTAFLATQAGIFLVLLAWKRRGKSRADNSLVPLVAATAFLVFGACMRLESFVMAALIASPLACLLLKDVSFRTLIPCSIAAIAAGTLIAAAAFYDNRAYEQDPAWAGYRSYNQLRGTFHDKEWTFYSPETASVFAKVGWSETDHAMIANWFSDEQQIYNENNLRSIVGAYPWKAAHVSAGFWRKVVREPIRNKGVLAILFAMPLILVLSGRQARIGVLLCMTAAVVLLAFVAWNNKVPPSRVYFPLLSFPLSVALLWPSSRWRVASLLMGTVGEKSVGWSRTTSFVLGSDYSSSVISVGFDRQYHAKC